MKNKVEALGGTWTRNRIEKLKRLRLEAVNKKEQIFLFDNQEIDTGFAKYLIEYVEGELND